MTTHALLKPGRMNGHWVGECTCGWAFDAEPDPSGEKEVLQAFELHVAAPDVLWPRVGQEMLVDCSSYAAGMGQQWLRVKRILPLWSAGVYPLKADVPGRGEGQWRRNEVLDVQEPGGEPGLKLTRQVLDTMLTLFPDGCDVIEGRRPGHFHAQRLQADEYGLLHGVLLVHDGLREGGCSALGISRNTYFRLPPSDEEATQ